jgi:Anti-sigma-K factor rskA
VTQDHEHIDELLAGYVLRSLSGPDAVEADRVLSEHVPTCARCRDTLTDFQAIMADLALEAAPIEPPETLLPRLHRELGAPPTRRRRPLQAIAVAAGVVLVAGLAGLSVSQGMRASHAQAREAVVKDAIDMAFRPNSKLVPVGAVTEIGAPGLAEFYLYGNNVPSPTAGDVYRVWLVSGSTPTYVGEFLPDRGFVAIGVPFDPSQYDALWITQAPEGSERTPPSAGDAIWSS